MPYIPRNTKVITQEQLETMKRLHSKGYSYEAIARHMHICRSTAYNYLTGKTKPYTLEELKLMDGVIE